MIFSGIIIDGGSTKYDVGSSKNNGVEKSRERD